MLPITGWDPWEMDSSVHRSFIKKCPGGQRRKGRKQNWQREKADAGAVSAEVSADPDPQGVLRMG